MNVDTIIRILHVSDPRLMYVELSLEGKNILFVNCYMPYYDKINIKINKIAFKK